MLSLLGWHNFSSLPFLPVFSGSTGMCCSVRAGGISPCAPGRAGVIDHFSFWRLQEHLIVQEERVSVRIQWLLDCEPGHASSRQFSLERVAVMVSTALAPAAPWLQLSEKQC